MRSVRLGFGEVGAVRCGKTIEIELDDGLSKADAEKRVKEMCEKLLANTSSSAIRSRSPEKPLTDRNARP